MVWLTWTVSTKLAYVHTPSYHLRFGFWLIDFDIFILQHNSLEVQYTFPIVASISLTHPKNTIGWGLQNRLPWRRLPHYSILISFPPATISGSEREKSQGSGEYGTWGTNSYRKSNNFFVVMWGIVLVDVAVFPSMRRRIGPIIHCSKRHTLWIPQRSPWPSQPKEPFSPSSERIRMETSIVSIVPWFQGYSDGPMFHERSHNPWRNPSDCD